MVRDARSVIVMLLKGGYIEFDCVCILSRATLLFVLRCCVVLDHERILYGSAVNPNAFFMTLCHGTGIF